MAYPTVAPRKHNSARIALMLLLVGFALLVGLFVGQRIHSTTSTPSIHASTPVTVTTPTTQVNVGTSIDHYTCRMARPC